MVVSLLSLHLLLLVPIVVGRYHGLVSLPSLSSLLLSPSLPLLPNLVW